MPSTKNSPLPYDDIGEPILRSDAEEFRRLALCMAFLYRCGVHPVLQSPPLQCRWKQEGKQSEATERDRVLQQDLVAVSACLYIVEPSRGHVPSLNEARRRGDTCSQEPRRRVRRQIPERLHRPEVPPGPRLT